MKVFRKAAAAALAAVMTAAVLVGCNEQPATSSAPDSSKVFNVGICQYADHAALNKASEGFKKALSDKLGNRRRGYERVHHGVRRFCREECGPNFCQRHDPASGSLRGHRRDPDRRRLGHRYRRCSRL